MPKQKQNLVQTWLSAIGLSPQIIETFEAAGIVNPVDLAELEVCHYPALGVQDAADRKKLFYLVQRVKMAVPAENDIMSPTPSSQQAGDTPMQTKGQLTDSFDIDHELDDDGIDDALEEQYKPLLHESDNSFQSMEDEEEWTSDEPPSPPINQSADSLDRSYLKDSPSPRNKREAAFLKRRGARLEKLTPPRKTVVDSPSPDKRKTKKSPRVSKRVPSENSSPSPEKPKRNTETRRQVLARLKRDNSKDDIVMNSSIEDSSPSPTKRKVKRKSPKKSAFDMEPITTSLSDDVPLEPPKTTRRSRRLEEKLNKNDVSNDDEKSLGSKHSATSHGSRTRRSARAKNTGTDTFGNDSQRTSSKGVSGITSTSKKERKSKLQNPTKRLSTIPSDRPSIMSPVATITSADDIINDILGDDDVVSVKSSSSRGSSRQSLSAPRTRTFSSDDRSYRSGNSTKSNTSRGGTRKSAKSSLANRAKSTPKGRVSMSNNRDLSPSKAFPGLDTTKSRSFDEFGKKDPETPKSTKSNASGTVFVHGGRTDKSWSTRVNASREANVLKHQEETTGMNLEGDREEEMRIRVVVRKRPMSKKEASKKDEVDVIHPLRYSSYGRVLVYQPKTRVDLTKEIETLPFAFDNVFAENSNNMQIYDETIRPLIPGAFAGRWASVFAYGQTGSGKTFTMMGSTLTGIKAKNQNVKHDENYGLYVLAARDLFEFASRKEYSHLKIGASLFEIYGGKLFDLLNNRNPVKCLENHKGRVCFPGLSEHPIRNADELMKLIEAGSNNRSTGSTSANRDSSRSHAVLQLHLRKTVGKRENVEHGRLTFIDLAGSERGADTNKASRTTRLEGADINTSLLALKEVIRALATGDSMTHIPFRGSKLTQVLKESFVGKNSRTVMVACVAPNITNCEHTLNTLRYADRVKERNPESGRLADSVAKASKIETKPLIAEVNNLAEDESRQKNIPATDGGDEDDAYEDDDNWLSDFDNEDDDDNEEFLNEGIDELNEVLRSPVATRLDGESFFVDSDQDIKNEINRPQISKKEAVAPLITTHRTIMTEMLGMVKQEMTLVNMTDADRELIDEYLEELEHIQDQQLAMISTLRESLIQYYAQRPSVADDDDDSFDDLRSPIR